MRRIYLDGGPVHGTVCEVPDSMGPTYYVPYLPPIRGFAAEVPEPSILPMADKLEYKATGTWMTDTPIEGQDAEVYALDMQTRYDLLPGVLARLANESSAMSGLLPADLAALDRIAWTAIRRRP